MTGFAGAVLCGGASRRMGRDKALIELNGQALSVRVADALRRAGAEPVIAVGGDAEALRRLGLTVVPDDDPGSGPLNGVASALRALPDAHIVAVLACDLLQPDPGAVQRLVDALAEHPGALAAVPKLEGRHHWHHAVWRASALPKIEAALAADRRALRDALVSPHLGTELVCAVTDLPPSAVADADTPADLGRR